MNKSSAAFDLSLQSFLEDADQVYLWTFTFREAYELKTAASLWSEASRNLVRRLGFAGIRVFELHPNGHGLHVHVIIKRRQDVNQVREIWNEYAGGRIHVCMIAKEFASYVGKYLQKQNRAGGLKGFRLWGCIGEARKTATKCGSMLNLGIHAYCFAQVSRRAAPSGGDGTPEESFHLRSLMARKLYESGDFDGYEKWRESKLKGITNA